MIQAQPSFNLSQLVGLLSKAMRPTNCKTGGTLPNWEDVMTALSSMEEA
jgi:hypothetical protein